MELPAPIQIFTMLTHFICMTVMDFISFFLIKAIVSCVNQDIYVALGASETATVVAWIIIKEIGIVANTVVTDVTPVIQSGITELASENVSGVYVVEQEKQKDKGPVDRTTTTVRLPYYYYHYYYYYCMGIIHNLLGW